MYVSHTTLKLVLQLCVTFHHTMQSTSTFYMIAKLKGLICGLGFKKMNMKSKVFLGLFFTKNKFEREKLNHPSSDNSCCGGDFSRVYNCASIFWFTNRNIRTIKHVFLHDYSLHMWLTPRARNFEPNEHKQLTKWFLKWVVSSFANFWFKISSL